MATTRPLWSDKEAPGAVRTLKDAASSGSGLGVAGASWFKLLGRTGLAARAVIYVVLTVLTLLIATGGRPPAQDSGDGALEIIDKQVGGEALLGALAAGLLAYALWRLVQAVTGAEPASPDRSSVWKRLGWLVFAGVYLVLFAKALEVMAGSSSTTGASSHPQPYAAVVLRAPAGQVWLGIAGAVTCVAAVCFAIWGVLHDYGDDLQEKGTDHRIQLVARVTGIAGNLTRGAIALLIGIYILFAVANDQPSQVKSVDQVLERVAHAPAGAWWLWLVAMGFLAFAAYSGIEARWRKV
jgi:hypothetical protein